MREADLERKICGLVRFMGGKAFKFVSPGNPGVPDRLCVLPGGRIVFVEVKRPGRENGLSLQQQKTVRYIRRLGQTVWVINNFDDFKARLEALYEV